MVQQMLAYQIVSVTRTEVNDMERLQVHEHPDMKDEYVNTIMYDGSCTHTSTHIVINNWQALIEFQCFVHPNLLASTLNYLSHILTGISDSPLQVFHMPGKYPQKNSELDPLMDNQCLL